MRTILIALAFAGLLSATDAKDAEIAHLKAQLAELQIRFQYEMKVCSMPDLMRAQLAEQETAAKLEAAKKAEAKPKEEPKP